MRSHTEVEFVQRAKEFQDKGDLQAAVIELKNALQQNPKNVEARWLLGEAYANLGLGKEAEAELRRAAEMGVNPEALKAALGLALLHQGEYARLLKEIEPSETSSKINTAKILVVRGRAQAATGDLDAGCDTIRRALAFDSTNIPAYHGLARCAVARGRMEEARVEIDKAIKLASGNSESWTLLGDLERAAGRNAEAEAAYGTALQYRPNNVNALLGRASAKIAARKLTEAKQDVSAVLKIAAAHPVAHHLRGVILFHQASYADAKTAFETALRSQPGYPPSVLWLGFSLVAQQSYEQALKQFAQFNQQVPDAVQVQILQALVQARMGKGEEAAATLRSVKGVNVDDPQSLALIGQTYMILGDNDLSATYLSRSINKNPAAASTRIKLAQALIRKGDTSAALGELDKALELDSNNLGAEGLRVQTLIRENKFDEALIALDALESKRPKEPALANARGGVLLSKQDEAGAKREFLRALSIQPEYAPATYNLALMAERKGDLGEARTYYRQIIGRQKDHLPALLALYRVELKAGRAVEARNILQEAATQHPTAVIPATYLARQELAEGQPLRALAVSSAALQAHPDELALLEVRGHAHLASGNASAALDDYKRLAKLQPDSADVRFHLATAHAALNDVRATRASLLDALKRKPDHFRAKAALARLDITEGKFADAIRLSRELQREADGNPEGAMILAAAYAKQKKYREAAEILDDARTKFPESGAVVVEAARIRWVSGEREESLALVREWQARHPRDVGVAVYLGDTYMAMKRDRDALAAYEQALQANPNHPGALNNVAWLLRKENPARALELAEKANSMKPNDPALLDTLGWLLIERKQVTRGLDLLRQARDLAPSSPTFQYHYAQALAQAGDRAGAKREIERLLTKHRKFAEEAEARALLGQL